MTISNDEVKSGYEICKSHIMTLIESSQILYDSKKYSTSLSLSILAREEEAKLLALQDHVKDDTNMTDEEWKQLTKNTKESTAHEYRLTQPAKVSRENIQSFSPEYFEFMKSINTQMGVSTNLTYEEMMSITPDYEKSLQRFDRIKQASFYLGRNSKWSNFSLKLRSKEEEKALAYVNLMQVKANYYSTISLRIHKEKIKLPITETLKDDSNFQEYLKTRNEMESRKYKNMVLLARQAFFKFN
ncbi:MAG: AbiV family abortive infection protein [Thaumarchaeota archaeon]|nr:AbiV family abortive infection protein [Nitrososphaerota archaeon]